MDLNSKIIEGIRQYPSLYANNNGLEERKEAWIKLAEKLKIQEQYLKVRWHCLLQRYQRDVNFRYANKMNFLQRNTESLSQEENWPEFVITEEDLKDGPQEDREEYVFLEIEDEENNKINTLKESDVESEKQYEDESKQTHNIAIEGDAANKDEEKAPTKIHIKIAETTNNCSEQNVKKHIKYKSISPTNITSKMEEMDMEKDQEILRSEKKVEILEVKQCQKVSVVEKHKMDEHQIRENKEVMAEKADIVSTERCEDVIFGELVSVMLKRMDETKKRNIKKEIMNLLLS